jgi:hypothetical protein
MLLGHVLPPSSWLKSKANKKPAMSRCQVELVSCLAYWLILKVQMLCSCKRSMCPTERHVVTTRKFVFHIVTAVRTSNPTYIRRVSTVSQHLISYISYACIRPIRLPPLSLCPSVPTSYQITAEAVNGW